MGKKNNTQPLSRKSSRARARGQVTRELATQQEEMVEEEVEARREERGEHLRRDMDGEIEEEVELDKLRHQNKDLDRVCETVQLLLSKNKVSAKNAFQVPLINLQRLPDFQQEGNNQYAWKRLSSTLESDSKIYGLRVDAIHSITFSMMQTMARRQQDVLEEQELQKPEEEERAEGRQALMAGGLQKVQGAEGENLENNTDNLNTHNLDMAMAVDPILQRNKRRFDQLGTTTMLMDTLGINSKLTLELLQQRSQGNQFLEWGFFQEEEWSVDDPLMSFVELGNFRGRLEEEQGVMHGEEDIERLFDTERASYDECNKQMMESELKKWKPVKQQVHFKSKGMDEAIDQANQWIQSILNRKNSRKIVGISRQDSMVRSEPRVDPEDEINFEIEDQSQDRYLVLLRENQKMEGVQEVEDRFLTAPSLVGSFQLSLNQLGLKPDPALPEMKTQQIEQQVDVRRQIVSILDAKRRMKSLLHERATFQSMYRGFCASHSGGQISPALCFLTLLHLTNENNLSLQQIDESDFYIK